MAKPPMALSLLLFMQTAKYVTLVLKLVPYQLTIVSTHYDIMQLIKIKQVYEKINIVINGGAGAPAVSPLHSNETSAQKSKPHAQSLTKP